MADNKVKVEYSPITPFSLKNKKEMQEMSSDVKKEVIPHIFDRVHSPYYGYGTVIGVEDVDTGYASVVLFDVRDNSLNSAGKYGEACNVSFFPVCCDVRKGRCFWVQVYVSSTEENILNNDEVRLVPFDSLEYRQHPIRVLFRSKYSASVVVRDNVGYIGIALDKTEEDGVSLPWHDGRGYTVYYDTIINTFWPKKSIYYWADIYNLSFNEDLMGTLPSFGIKEEDNNNNKEDEEKADVKVEYSPINPSHYRVDGIPEAIDIMEHLMTQEQFKGFLWGNIIKYAYRYGRKGDEHDTAGKIEWYANRLKEACGEKRKS